MAEERLEAVLEPLDELFLTDLAALELEERQLLALRQPLAHRQAEVFGGDAAVVLERGEGGEQRRGEDAAEVGDDRP